MVGAFHLQGACWDRTTRRFATHKPPATLEAIISPWDVVCMHDVIDALPGVWADQFVAFRNSTGQSELLGGSAGDTRLTIAAGDADIVTIVPLVEGPNGARFGPIGLPDMLNSGGAVLEWTAEGGGFCLRVRGEGRFVAHSSEPPRDVELDGCSLGKRGAGWQYRDGLVSVTIPECAGSVKHTLGFRF